MYKLNSGISDVFTGANDFIAAGENGEVSIDEQELKSASDTIFNIVLLLGMCIAVIYIGILGIKFMIGSVEEKAEIKESLIPFIIGCIIIFGAFGIWKIFVTIGNNLTSETVQTTEKKDESQPTSRRRRSWGTHSNAN